MLFQLPQESIIFGGLRAQAVSCSDLCIQACVHMYICTFLHFEYLWACTLTPDEHVSSNKKNNSTAHVDMSRRMYVFYYKAFRFPFPLHKNLRMYVCMYIYIYICTHFTRIYLSSSRGHGLLASED